MTHIQDLSEKYDLNNWPHRFTKDGNPYQVGEDKGEMIIGKGDAIMAAPMICVDCGIKFVSGMQSRPPDPCPARNQKREMKRILG